MLRSHQEFGVLQGVLFIVVSVPACLTFDAEEKV